MIPTTNPEHLCHFKPRYVLVTSATGSRDIAFQSQTTGASTTEIQLRQAAVSSTEKIPPVQSLERALQQVFAESRHDVFEDGMKSEFSRRLVELVLRKGEAALLELNAQFRAGTTSKNLVAEALRWLGLIRDAQTHAFRRWILTDMLRSSSISIRDGAIVGLSSLDDPATKPAVQVCLKVEESEELRRDLAQLLQQLEMPEAGYALSVEEDS